MSEAGPITAEKSAASRLLIVCGRVYVTVRCPSVRLSQLSTAAAACGGFAAVSPAGRRYRSIAAWPAPSSKGGQCHIYSRRRRLNTDCTLPLDFCNTCRTQLAFVSISGTQVCYAKTTEPIEIQFGGQTRVGPRNLVLDGKGHF